MAERKPIPESIPYNLHDGIAMFVDEHRLPGDFLRAVLENNLAQSVGRADPQSLAALKDLVVYLWNEVPGECWGSERAVRAWVQRERATCEHCLERREVA